MVTISRNGPTTRLVVPGQRLATALAWALPPIGVLGVPMVASRFMSGDVFVPLCQLFFCVLCITPLLRPIATQLDVDRQAGTVTASSRYAYRPAKRETFRVGDVREVRVSGSRNGGWIGVYAVLTAERHVPLGGEVANVSGARAEVLGRYEALREATGAGLPPLANVEAARV